MLILAVTWRLVNEIVYTRQDLAKNQVLIWRLGRTIKASLQEDRQRQEKEAGAEVETLMGSDPPIHWEAWHRIKVLYKAAVDHAPPPARFTLKRITAEWVEMYSYVLPPGTNIPISVEPFPVDNSIPMEDDIKWAAKHLRDHHSKGPSEL